MSLETFHQNDRTPSAHLYSNDDGYRLWCFSESRIYTSYDVYKIFYPKINTNKLAEKIYNRFPKLYQDKIITDLGLEKEIEHVSYLDELKKFKRHNINITDLLQVISESYIDE